MAKKPIKFLTLTEWDSTASAVFKEIHLTTVDVASRPELIARVYVEQHCTPDTGTLWPMVAYHRYENIVVIEHRDSRNQLALLFYDLKQKLDSRDMMFRLSLWKCPLILPYFDDYLGKYTAEQLADPDFKLE